MDCEERYYAIKDVSDITGVNSVTLRAWQRRYGLLNPKRTEKGHRLYSEQDIEKIRLILSWLEKGVAIGKVRPLIEGAHDEEKESEQPENKKSVDSLLSALIDCNGAKLDKLLIQIMKEYPLDVFITHIVNPVESEIKKAENPLVSIQLSLWQSSIMQRCIALITQAKKRSSKLCYLLSFDHPDDYRMWLQAWLLTDLGYNVTVLGSLDGRLTSLGSALEALKVSKVVVIGERRISASNLEQLTKLAASAQCSFELVGSIRTIHKDVLVGP
ncbi:MerR family transcriptional regulator [Photobacterium sp. OFAV2-7]|uniref:MerR family transcriptional regulator n=1 Tax=Photobacterium sp. OFAV2-7 TaxID=2917748 RepID=UPI001EF4AD84|nr:MerR family transcriptional regulator [Photobacterium sp. OFAV2-7]MCG7586146.1 MerR family transcriptional regulator [Photobacterium sp. OFAV2-7]